MGVENFNVLCITETAKQQQQYIYSTLLNDCAKVIVKITKAVTGLKRYC